MGLSTRTFGWLRDGIGNLAAAREIESKLAGSPSGTAWYVNGSTGADSGSHDGKSWAQPFDTIAHAESVASAGDVIFVAPGEYNEDITIDVSQLSIVGVGSRHSVRVTGTSAGTKTAVTISGVNEVGLYNLNLEGRTSSGSALVFTGQVRRVEVKDCKIHGGDQAIKVSSASGGQTVDVRFEDCVIANSAIGVNVVYSGGDPCHQLYFKDCEWLKITTDCVKENGATHDYTFIRPVFGLSDGSEPTRILDIDETGTTGQIIDPRFCTTLFASSKIAIASGVMIIGWRTEREVEATDGGTNGRPD